MAITLPSGFIITNQQPIDSRLVLTKAQMAAMIDAKMPQNYLCVCKDDGKLYIYNYDNAIDPNTGRFRLYLEDELESKQDKLIAGENVTIDENNVISVSASKKNAYNYIKQIADYLFETQYSTENIDYDYANEFFKNSYTPKFGRGWGCSGVVDDKRILRQFDWYYDDGAEFIVRRPADPENGIYASIGVSFGANVLTKSLVESGEYNDAYRIIPFTTTDGINDAGLYAQLNVLQNLEGGFDINPEASEECCILMSVRYILDHCSNFEDVENFLNTVHIFKTDKLNTGYHILLAKDDEWEVIEFTSDGHITVTNGIGENQMPHGIMTNFRTNGLTFDDYTRVNWTSVEEYGMGVERYDLATNLFIENKTLEELREELVYTNLYTDPLKSWKTEYAGEEGTHGEKLRVLDAIEHPEYFDQLFELGSEAYRTRTRAEGNDTWQSTHSAIYDLTNKKFNITIQERFNEIYEFSLVENSDIDLSEYAKLTDLEIGKEIIVQRTVGGIAEGTIYAPNTKIAKIIEDLLGNSSPLPGEGNLYYGLRSDIPISVEGMEKVEVNSEDLKSNGYTWKNITAENEYVCLAVDKILNVGCYEINQNGFGLGFRVIDLGDQILYVLENKITDTGMRLLYKFDESSPGPRDSKLYRSVNSAIPTTVEGMESISADPNELRENGYTWRNISANNEYICLAIDRSLNISCYEINQNGFGLGFETIDLGNQILYVIEDKITDTGIRLLYKFE